MAASLSSSDVSLSVLHSVFASLKKHMEGKEVESAKRAPVLLKTIERYELTQFNIAA